MPNVHHSTTELTAAPDWLFAPSSVRLSLPPGIKLELMTMVIVSNDQRKEAALIGILRNHARALRGTVLSLSYVGADGQSVLRSVSNAAYVSDVPVDGLLPFRLPLLVGSAAPEGVTAFEIVIAERVDGARRALPADLRGDLSVKDQRDNAASVVVEVKVRDVDVVLPESSRVFVTLLLHDKSGSLLDVLAGSPASDAGSTFVRVRFDSFLPLAGRVKASKLYVEADRSAASGQNPSDAGKADRARRP
jgi:hypothetical protein